MGADQDQASAPVAVAPAASEPAPEPTPVPAAVEAPSAPETPLTKLSARLPDITSKAGHSEMWGVQLSSTDHIPTKVVLQKFLRANNGDVAATERQLTNALEWRKKMNPGSLVMQTFDKKKFNDLGFVTTHKADDGKETIITWNIYGAVEDNKATFGDVNEFIKWRAAIMELGVQKLQLDQVTEPIPEDGNDPYQMIQVHDYQSVSFFRMDPAVKAATRETIAVFSMAYPELLAHKYFVNVPAIMGWMFGVMKLLLAPATLKKFHPMTSGTTLATELKSIVSSLPKEYGGQGSSVKDGVTVSLAEAADIPKETSKDAETETTPKEEPAPVITLTTEKPVEENKPAELVLPIREEKPVEETKLTEELKPISEEVKPAQEVKPATETTEPVESEKKAA
ncbi:Fc.00g035930.m01.CDS01 [Cosmosporella sp. VM-42]